MSNKRLYIEALGLVDDHFSGIGQYILGILKAIDEILDQKPEAEGQHPNVYVLIPKDKLDKFKQYNFRHIRVKTFPFNSRVAGALWSRRLLPPIDLYFGKGYYVFTRFVSMPLLHSKNATVIYDLSYELYPQYSSEKNAKFLSKMVGKTIHKANTIITISENAKKEIAKFYKIEGCQIKVIYPAADLSVYKRVKTAEVKLIKEKLGINGKYIISLSNLEPRKNLISLIEAYCDLGAEAKNVSLLLVGEKGWKSQTLMDTISSKIAEGYKIILPSSYIKDIDKVSLLSGAEMLVYPSHYEGFGMPPLEALACGTPVIVSNNSSLPEVVGDIGTVLNTNDSNGIKKAILHELKFPSNVLSLGPEHAKKFSWQASAHKILGLLKN